MLPASNRGAGMNMGFPDVCNTPVGPATVPIPYPNIAQNCQATPFSPNVKITQMNALNLTSVIPLTSGDEPGVAHWTIKGPGRFTQGNPVVKVNNMPAINLMNPSTGNNMNNAVGSQSVPCVTNVFFTWANDRAPAAKAPREIDQKEIQELVELLNSAEAKTKFLGNGVGAIAIELLGFHVPTQVENAIEDLLVEGLKVLILDLRGCRGGDLRASMRLADDFLQVGSPLWTMIDDDLDEISSHARRALFFEVPLVVLVDGGTASAAELLAAALQDNDRAILIGEKTYGKGTAQRVAPTYEPSGAVYITCGAFRRVGGRAIDSSGITPDIEISKEGLAERELESSLRRQLGDVTALEPLVSALLTECHL